MLPMNATDKNELRERAVAMLRRAIAKGLDVAAFADDLDINPEAIGRWLAKENLPPFATAERIIALLA